MIEYQKWRVKCNRKVLRLRDLLSRVKREGSRFKGVESKLKKYIGLISSANHKCKGYSHNCNLLSNRNRQSSRKSTQSKNKNKGWRTKCET